MQGDALGQAREDAPGYMLATWTRVSKVQAKAQQSALLVVRCFPMVRHRQYLRIATPRIGELLEIGQLLLERPWD